jgi:hypothetical protein
MVYWGPWITGPNFANKNIVADAEFVLGDIFGTLIGGFEQIIPISDVALLDGVLPEVEPPAPPVEDAARVIRRQWREGQTITFPSHSMQLVVEITAPVGGPGTYSVYDLSTRFGPGPLPPVIDSGIVSSPDVPVIVVLQDLAMLDYDLGIVISSGNLALRNPYAYWVVNFPDYRYLYSSAPPLHQRQRTDGLGGGPPHAGRNLTSRQLSPFQRGTL